MSKVIILTDAEFYDRLKDAVSMFLEYRDKHGLNEDHALDKAVDEIYAGTLSCDELYAFDQVSRPASQEVPTVEAVHKLVEWARGPELAFTRNCIERAMRLTEGRTSVDYANLVHANIELNGMASTWQPNRIKP